MGKSPNCMFRPTRSFILSLLLSVGLLSMLSAGGKKPSRANDSSPKVVRYDWVKDGHTKKLKAVSMDKKGYFPIGELAKISQAQLRWQSVTQQVCLSRTNGLLCFNWDRSTVYDNGSPLKKKYKLPYSKNKLFVPLDFATSKTFQKFTGSEIKINYKERILLQDSPVTLTLPPVENLGDHYRVGVDFEEKTQYQVLDQSKKRVWIRFVRGRFMNSEILKGDKVVKEVRISQKRRSADLIVKLGSEAGAHHIQFDKEKQRLVIHVETKKVPYPAAIPLASKKTKKSKNEVARKKYKPVTDKRIKTIVIDAGHGGLDSGAVGVRGTVEKNINLKVAKMLAKELKKDKKLRVIMTRKKDEFIPLSQRTEIANEAKADLFVSIHCNSSFSSKTRGFEVYILAEEATDEAAAAVARVENSVVRLETKSKKGSSKLNELLASMAVYNFINESSECAAHICRGVKKKSPVRSTAVREANFHVLRGAQMPGVLVELEYLSNPVTELKLRSSRYRSQVVKGLAAGIREYDRRSRLKLQPVTAKKQGSQQDF